MLLMLVFLFLAQANQLGVYRAFVDNYEQAVETAEKCCQANSQFAEISEVRKREIKRYVCFYERLSCRYGEKNRTKSKQSLVWCGQSSDLHHGIILAPCRHCRHLTPTYQQLIQLSLTSCSFFLDVMDAILHLIKRKVS